MSTQLRVTGNWLDSYLASDSRLEVMREGSKVIDLETSDCSYCTSGEPCSEAVFMFEYLTATTDDPHMRNYGLLHACRKPDRVSFTFVSDLDTKPAIAAQAEKLPAFDWMVDDNALSFCVDQREETTMENVSEHPQAVGAYGLMGRACDAPCSNVDGDRLRAPNKTAPLL